MARHLDYRKIVEAALADHAAGKTGPAEARPEHEAAETHDKPASKIAGRRKSLENQDRTPEAGTPAAAIQRDNGSRPEE